MAKKKRPLARRPRPGQGAATAKKPQNTQADAAEASESGLHEVTESTAETAHVEAPRSDSETEEEAAHDDGSEETDVALLDDGVVQDEDPVGDDVDDDHESAISDEVDPLEKEAADSQLATSGDVEEEDVSSFDPAHGLIDAEEQEDDVYTGPSLVQDGPLPDEAEIEDIEGYLKGLVEAIIFSSDRPQTAKDVARAARLDRGRVQELIDQLVQETQERGIRLVAVADGYAFRTHPNYSSYVRDFLAQRPVRLSRAQLETLAIIAYRQPLTRPEVDDIRGVDSGAVIKLLLERELIRVLGKKDEPGRPMIYGTTHQFLELFSLGSLRDLPTLREFTELNDDSRAKFELEVGEPAPEGPIDMAQYDSTPGSPEEGEDQALEEGAAAETIAADTPEAENQEDSFPQIDEAEGDPWSGDDEAASSESEHEGGDAESLEEEDAPASSDDYVAPSVSPEDEEEFPDDEDDDDDDEDEDEDEDDDED